MGRGKKPLSGRWTVVSPTNRFASVPFANVLCRSTKKRNERCSCLCFVLSAMIQKSTIRMYIPRSFKHWSQAKAVRELTQQVSRTTSEVSEQDVGETTVNPWASLFSSQCLSCVLFCFLWRQRGLSGGRRGRQFFNAKILITYYNFLQTSNWVCHHHLLSLVIIVFTCLGSSLFLHVKILQ